MYSGRRAAGLLLGAGVLFAVGTNVQAGWILALAAMLAGVVAAGLFLPTRMVRGLEVERRAPLEAFAGEPVEVDLVVRNRTRRTKLSLLVSDAFIAPAAAFVPSLGPREHVRVTTTRDPARRGIVEGEPVVVSSTAPFGIVRARRPVPAGGRTVVFPRVVPLRRLDLLERPSRPEPSAAPVPRRGHGQDFLGVREYRSGDSLRHVHWPSTARHGTLIVREFEREEPRRLTVVVDTLADAGDGPESALDLACAVAASAVSHAAVSGALVTLVAGDATGPRSLVRPSRAEALEWLAAARPGGVAVAVAEEFVRDGAEPLLVVAPAWSSNAARLPGIVAAAASRGAPVHVVLVDAAAFGPGTEPALDEDASRGLTAAIAASGATVSRLGPGGSIAGALAGAGEPS